LSEDNSLYGVEAASEELIRLIQKHGRTITYADAGSEELRYLDSVGAEANVGGPALTHILLRAAPSKVALLEEFLHGTQWRLGLIQRLGVARAELAVKEFMLRHRRLLGIGDEDVAILWLLRDDAERIAGRGGSS
jgi:hypothetical protein